MNLELTFSEAFVCGLLIPFKSKFIVCNAIISISIFNTQRQLKKQLKKLQKSTKMNHSIGISSSGLLQQVFNREILHLIHITVLCNNRTSSRIISFLFKEMSTQKYEKLYLDNNWGWGWSGGRNICSAMSRCFIFWSIFKSDSNGS